MNKTVQNSAISIGVGLRHQHYSDVLSGAANIDFVEVHAENFFAEGGAALAFLQQVAQIYPVSVHATTLGLGSAAGVPAFQVDKLRRLIDQVPPLLLSDHACFAWSSLREQPVHAGDLLPIPFNETSLQVMTDNLQRVQDQLGRELMVENLSAYLKPAGSNMGEAEFLVRLCEQTGSRLLLDLNNIVVNAVNDESDDILADAASYINSIPVSMVGEMHLAGCTPISAGEVMIDDHSQPVPDVVWAVYRLALQRFGAVPSLVEWDTALPSWDVLVAEADKARAIAHQELVNESALSLTASEESMA